MRRVVPLLTLILLAGGCHRPEANSDETQPASTQASAPKPKPVSPQAEPTPPTAQPQDLAKEEKFRRLKQDAEEALNKLDLRAAATALEQALALKDEADLWAVFDDTRSKLRKYDENRQRAAELRKDPGRLEAAVLALQDAKTAWDTPEVRQQIEEYSLAMLDRRERVGVVDFEVRGGIDNANVGRTFAEVVLNALQKRYDSVDAAQLTRAFEALKIQPGDLAGSLKALPEVADALKARYLVFGNVTRFGGWIANARLVDLRTGMVVRTAKIMAPTEEKFLAELPGLGTQLAMTDQEWLDFVQEKVQKEKVVVARVDENARIPPPPPPPARPAVRMQNPAPVPPALLNLPPAPALGGLALRDLGLFPAQAPILGVGAPVLPVGPLDVVTRARLLRIAVDLGDQFLAVGRVADAFQQYQLAFALAPAEPLVQARLNLVAGLLPGGVGLNPLPLLPLITQPRVVVFDFVTPPGAIGIPPWLGWATADNLAPYFSSTFEVVDRRLAYWYMARMGLSLRDVAIDPSARFWLGRALNVRYFVFGALTPTGSFDATTRLVDAELNFLVGSARIHVRDPLELQWRLPELAQVTLMNPFDRARYEQGMQQFRQLLAQGNQLFAIKNFVGARNMYQLALNAQPGNVEAMFHIQRTFDAEFAAARGLPLAQRMGLADRLLDRERRRDNILRDAGVQLADDRARREGRDRDRRNAWQAVDQKAADRITNYVAGQVDGKNLTPQQRQRAHDLLLSAGRLQRNKTVDNLVARVTPPLQPQPKTPPVVDPLKQRQVDFNALMSQGHDARLGKRFGDAVTLYSKALELSPGDPRATKARDYSVFMRDGVSLLRKGKPRQAADAFRGARDLVKTGPDFRLADQSWRKAEYDHNMAEGRKAMKARRPDDAVPFFREATRLFANDPEATQLLQQALQQSKKSKGKSP